MTKLVLYTENYFSGGLERFVFDFINSKLFDIHVIVNSENDRIIKFAILNNIKYDVVQLSNFKLHLSKNNIQYNKFVKIWNFLAYYLSMILNYFKIKKILKQLVSYKNIIIVNGGYPAALSCLVTSVASKKLGFDKVGICILSSPSPHYSTSKIFRFVQASIDDIVDKYIDFYIPNSKEIKFNLVKFMNINENKIHVVYTGVDIPKEFIPLNTLHYQDYTIEKKENESWIAMVALLGSTKRQDLLIKAMLRLDTNVKLLLVGDGPNKETLLKDVNALGLQNRVVFMGWMDNPQEVYQFADMIVFMSNQEGLPYAISEAMSYKIPIIASLVGGIPEQIVDKYGGLLVDNKDVDDLVEKINFLRNNENIRKNFIDFSFQRVKNIFSTHAMNQEILKLYK
ncbi:MAG: glycosyltransferase family 4 protein [Campylobacterales bacterium]|nr:glycosyltransferase family 4 protein [Campylobacterales bacterium]